VFKFFLVDEHDQGGDPAGFHNGGPELDGQGDVLLGRGEKFRILEIRTELLAEMLDAGFNGIHRGAVVIHRLIRTRSVVPADHVLPA
jgi:hypothetical protein